MADRRPSVICTGRLPVRGFRDPIHSERPIAKVGAGQTATSNLFAETHPGGPTRPQVPAGQYRPGARARPSAPPARPTGPRGQAAIDRLAPAHVRVVSRGRIDSAIDNSNSCTRVGLDACPVGNTTLRHSTVLNYLKHI